MRPHPDGQHLKAVAKRDRRVARVRGEEFIVESAAVAAAVPFGIEGEAGHQNQRRLVVRLGFVRDGLGDVIRAGRDGV